MENQVNVEIILASSPSQKQRTEVSNLQKQCFVDVDEEEANEDFYHIPAVQVLAYINDTLVGWAGVHITEQSYRGKQIKIGGYGICTHPDFRRMGIATKVVGEAMNYLKQNGCDIGFLSVNPQDEKSIKLHQKFGFVMLPQHFSWKNSKDELKEDVGGMVASIGSNELFHYVLSGHETLYVGNGYW